MVLTKKKPLQNNDNLSDTAVMCGDTPTDTNITIASDTPLDSKDFTDDHLPVDMETIIESGTPVNTENPSDGSTSDVDMETIVESGTPVNTVNPSDGSTHVDMETIINDETPADICHIIERGTHVNTVNPSDGSTPVVMETVINENGSIIVDDTGVILNNIDGDAIVDVYLVEDRFDAFTSSNKNNQNGISIEDQQSDATLQLFTDNRQVITIIDEHGEEKEYIACVGDEVQLSLTETQEDVTSPKYNKQQNVRKHNIQHDNNLKPFGCRTCGKLFTQIQNLKRHMVVHTGERPYECNMCEKKFTQLQNLKLHIENHRGSKPYKCNRCGRFFSQLCNLKRHYLTHKSIDERPLACPLCDKRFIQQTNLQKHIERHQANKTNKRKKLNISTVCELCNERLSSLGALKRHIVFKHMDSREFLCNFDKCGKAFHTMHHLERHILTHSSEKLFTCETCDIRYSDPQAYKYHLISHFQKSVCPDCGQDFASPKSLSRHIVTKHQKHKFVCNVCDKSFPFGYLYKRHLDKFHNDEEIVVKDELREEEIVMKIEKDVEVKEETDSDDISLSQLINEIKEKVAKEKLQKDNKLQRKQNVTKKKLVNNGVENIYKKIYTTNRRRNKRKINKI